MTIAVIIFIFFVLVAASVVFARIHFALWRQRGEKLHTRVHSWFFSVDENGNRLLFFRLRKKTSAQSSKKKKTEKTGANEAEKDKKSGKSVLSFAEIWADREFFLRIISCILRFLRDLLHSFPAGKKNEGHIYVSSAEPDELGFVCAAIYPLIYANSLENTLIFEPDFTVDEYDADVYGKFAVYTSIARILFIILLLLHRLPKIAIFKLFMRLRKKRKTHALDYGSKPSAL